MHILLEDKSLKRFLARERVGVEGSAPSEQNHITSNCSQISSEGGPVFLSIVSVVFLMLFLFMGVPAYILYAYDNSWQSVVEKAETEFSTGVVSLTTIKLPE